MTSYPPSPHNMAFSPLCRTPQLAPQDSNRSSETLHSLIDPQPSDFNGLQKGQAHNQGYGHAGSEGSRELLIRGLVFAIAGAGIWISIVT